MQTSPFLLPQGDGWREFSDPARGLRRYRFDAHGRPREAVLPDGSHLVFTHDARGRLRRVEGAGSFIDIDYGMAAGGVRVSVADPRGSTDVLVGGRGRTLARGAEELAIDLDRQGQPRRVRVPGAAEPLLYEARPDGSVAIGAPGLPALIVQSSGRNLEIKLSGGGGWTEGTAFGVLHLVARAEDGAEAGGVAVRCDLLGRTLERRWRDGGCDTFQRDEAGRLIRFTRDGQEHVLEYSPDGDLVAERGPAGDIERDIDAGGRVRRLRRAGGAPVDYEHDAAGRRVRRTDERGETRYHYDGLFGQLVAVERPDGSRVSFDYDGLGRRICVRPERGELRREHRDADGRLWAITGEGGRLLHTFLWWGDRLLGRVDGPLAGGAVEGYLCDAAGTLLGIVRAGEGGGVSVERVHMPPFGAVTAPGRPTLYGHVGDPETGLIHFGARDLDPEIGLFLTPDPWHGAEDDPRLWSGGKASELSFRAEIPASGIHAYALCQFDPVGRVDRDGHFNWAGFLGRFLPAITWGSALTAISVFFFLPLNILMEILLDLFSLFTVCGNRPRLFWKNHHIHQSIGVAGSGRQGAWALGLNGVLPRVVSGGGIDSDRAVTIGAVIWINREELNRLDRPSVIELWDIAGPPNPAGAPTRGADKLNDAPMKQSVVAVVGTRHSNGKQMVHVTGWTRAFGNAVGVNGVDQQLEDRVIRPGDTFIPGSIHLAQALPEEFPFADSAASKDTLAVHEYLHPPAAPPHPAPAFPVHTATAELDPQSPLSFALELPKGSDARVGDHLEIRSPNASPQPDPATAHRRITDVLKEVERDVVVLDRPLPPQFTAAVIDKGLKVQHVKEAAPLVRYEKWTQVAAAAPGALDPRKIEQVAADAAPGKWPPPLAKDDLIEVIAATPIPAPPGGVAEDRTYARAQALWTTLKLTPTLGGGNLPNGTDVFLMLPDGASFKGKVANPAAAEPEIAFQGAHPSLSAGDLLMVGAAAAFARVKDVAADKFTVEAPLPVAAGAQIDLQRYKDKDTTKEKAKHTSQSGDEVTVALDRMVLLPAGAIVRFELAGKPTARKVDSITKVAVELSDDVRGTGQLTVIPAEVTPRVSYSKIKRAVPARLLKWITGSKPADFGSYPDVVLEIRPVIRRRTVNPVPPDNKLYVDFDLVAAPLSVGLDQAVFFIRPPAAGANLDPSFTRTWRPIERDGAFYWLLDANLPISNVEQTWKKQQNPATGQKEDITQTFSAWDAENGRHLAAHKDGIVTFEIREFRASGVRRTNAAGRVITAHPHEALVPLKPTVHDTARKALLEHELHHTVQNCYWGPILNALPIVGFFQTIDDAISAAGVEQNNFFHDLFKPQPGLGGMGWAHMFSIGGLMEMFWRLITGGFFTPDDPNDPDYKPKFDYTDWQTLFAPLPSLLLRVIPDVDPNAPAGDRWGVFLLRLLRHAFDLRTWMPFTGFVPTILPDSGRSFLEQQASWNSGDNYTTILSADDRYHRNAPDRPTRRLGDVTRLMAYTASRDHRMIGRAHADLPGSPVKYVLGTTNDLDAFWIELDAAFAGSALLHKDLYHNPGAPVVALSGPPSAPAPVEFIRVAPGAVLKRIYPKLRSMVPLPPRVARAAGFYFLPVTPGKYNIHAYDRDADDPSRNAMTQDVIVTVESEVLLGDDPVPWADPVIAARPAPVPPIERYVTELSLLRVKDRSIDGWEIDVAAGAITASNHPDKTGWKLQAGSAAAPAAVRVRLFRILAKDDAAFSLEYKDVPSLNGRRSYLDASIWIPVRDFEIKVIDIPKVGAKSKDYDQPLQLDLVIPPVSVTAAPQGLAPGNLAVNKIAKVPGVTPPRGERWELGPFAAPIEDEAKYDVAITYGNLPNRVVDQFVLTFKPVIEIKSAGGDYDVHPGAPLELTITGGAAPYSVSFEPSLPAGTAHATPAANKVTITITTPPASDTPITVKVQDGGGKKGVRRIHLREV